MAETVDRLAGLSPERRALLEALVRQQKGTAPPRPRPEAIPVQPRPARSFPLSFAQERLWFLAQLDPASADYNIPLVLDFRGSLEPVDLRASLAEVVRRHEMLRTRFALEEGRPVQIVEPPGDFPLPLVDLAGLGAEIRGAEARRLAIAEARRPFDLAAGHLLRALLLRSAADEHRLVANMHHIVSDGWSCSVMSREMGQIYRARLAGSAAGLAPLVVQYADFAVWQRQILSGAALERQVEHWRQRLAGLPPVLELPSDRPRPPVRSPRGASVGFVLSEAASDRLRELARGDGGTLFITLLSGFFALLQRYSGRDDLCVGSPTAGRRLVETEGLIGFFVNTLVLRADLSGDPSFREVLVRVREAVFDAHAHQDLPFERLVAELAPERSLGHTPLFQVSFTFQNLPSAALDLGGLRIAGVDVETGTTKFDLGLTLADGAGALQGSLEHSLDLFDTSTIQGMAGHLRTLLEAVAADPSRRLSELPLLRSGEAQQILREWNDTGTDYGLDAGRSLQELIRAQAERTPDAVAAVSGDEHLSYRGLALRAGRLAGRLAAAGVAPDAVVGICSERSLEMIVGLLGILTAGGAYLPLDPSYPQERLSFVLASAGAVAVLVQGSLADRLPPSPPPFFPLELAEPPVLPLDAPVRTDPGNLAYVIYTSGSTGAPKGAMVSHRAIVNRLLWMQAAYGLSPADRVLQKTPFGFDVSVWEFFWPLLVGAPLVFARPEGHKDPFYLAALIEEQGITVLHFVPSMLRAFLEADRKASCGSVRAVMASGEVLPFELTERFHERMSGELHNLYGPTEAAVDVSFWACEPEDGRRIVPIGRPIANLRLHVIDRNWQPVPRGVPGELLIGGVGLGRGYLGRPDLTAERFVPDPFTAEECEAGGRLYRTGDLARHLPAGEIEFLGRLDFQVKIRGFRIELGEIEAALLAHPAVRESAVLMRQDRLGEPALVACLVTDGRPLPAEELRGFLRNRLPEAMVPSGFVLLEALPLSSNGKLDRKALARLVPDAQAGEERPGRTDHAAPGTPVEEILAGIWEEVLRRGQVGVRDSFFDLGGHSLLATQVVSRVREAFGVEMPVRDLFEAPTVQGLAARIERRRGSDGSGSALAEAPPIVPVERQGDLPLSFAQQRLWFLEKLEPGSAAYNVPMAVRLGGPLAAGALARALAEVVRRHEALRTTFPERDGRPVQVISPAPAVPLAISLAISLAVSPAIVELSGLPEAEREAEALRLAMIEARRPFDLAAGPLIRATLLRLDEQDHVLLVTMHHIVTDGWSMGIFLRELTALYTALSQGRPGELPELPVQYGDFAVWQRSWLAGEVLESQLAYWRQRLAGAPALLDLPLDRPRPAVESHRGAALPLALEPPLSSALVALARREGATPFMVLLAGFAALLGRYSGQDDVVVGSPIAGRNRREIEGLIGFFVNTLALRVELLEGPGFLDLLRRVRQTALDAYAHQDIPFERLVEELVTDRGLGHSPLFQATLTVQNAPSAALEVPAGAGWEVRPLAVESATAKFELSLDFALAGEELLGGLEYNTDLFDASTARRLAGHFTRLLEGALAAPESPLPEILLLAPAERQQLLHEWNDTEAVYPAAGLCLHELVWRQAERAPDAVAVTLDDEHLSYAELRRRAGWLAHRLRHLGVGPEVPVAIGAERSPEIVVGLLGILQAGGAYVPLDPDYPAERLAFMVEDSAASLLLTQRHLLERLPASGARPVLLEELARPEPGLPPDAPGGVVADNLLYVIYTSGSTGRPKGVMVRHRGVVNRLLWALQDYPIRPSDRVLQKASFSFDFSVEECFSPLLAGGRLVLARPGGQRDSAYLREAVVEQEITLLHFVPAVLQAFLAEEGLEACRSLRFVFSGADTLTPELRERFEARMPAGVLLRNQYGPTEISIDVTEWVCRPGLGGAASPIGRPVGNGLAYVVDPRLEPVPIGVAGELLLGGAGLARGYQRRPDLTAERFVPSPWEPWGSEEGARLYRTGDRVRLLPDGNLEFLGRVDHQVKIRGYRIEPGEIEALLATHPSVREAVVVAREDRRHGRSLLACVVPAAGAASGVTAEPEELRSFLRAQLPDYMVPPAFAVLEELPLAPSGKVDRKALAQLAAQFTTGAEEPPEAGVAPRMPAEEILAAIFAEVLRHERVGIHDGFFDLGGHSLLATQVVSRIRQAFGVELPIRDLFEAPTVAGLAERIERLRRAGTALEAPPIVPVPRGLGEDGVLPLSFAQQRLWFLHRLEPDSALYNVPLAVRLSGPLDTGALARALGGIGRRHEALRTTFAERQGHPMQVIAAEPRLPLTLLDLSGLPPAEREAEALRQARTEATAPFDLAAGPLVRAALLRLGEAEHVLLVTLHHIVTDGWSMGIFLRELTALYGGRELPELPVQYGDFAAWQRSWLSGAALEAQLAYWRERLAGAPVRVTLPTDRPRPAVATHRGASRPLALTPELSRSLTALSRRAGATPFMVLLAGFAALLGRYAGQDDVVVGSPIAGRTRQETEGLIGFFVNTLALRVELGDGLDFSGLLRQVRRTALDAYAHQDIPFERLVEELVTERDLGHSPLFQVALTVENAPPLERTVAGGLAGLDLRPVEVESGTAKFELSLGFALRGEELAGSLEFNTDLFDAATAERLARHLARLLAAATTTQDLPLQDLPLLDWPEAQQVLLEWNDTGAAYPGSRLCLHELVREQAERMPEAVAVVAGEESAEHLTHAELHRRVGWLAHRLRRLGVAPEVPVALCAERSLEMVVGLLGILEAGGAYVPLDPDYPAERLAYMVEDSAAPLLLAQRHLLERWADRLPEMPGARLLFLDELARPEAGAPPALPGGATPDNLLYVIYTSGSTGRPKGVMVRHRGVVNRLLWAAQAYPVTPADRVLQKAPFSFDFSVWECFGTLLSGARLVLARPGGQRDGAYLARTVVEQGITLLHFVPAMLQAFLEEEGLERCRSLRFVFSGGDTLAPETVERFRARMPPGVLLRNQYGPTEISIDVTEWICRDERSGRKPPIGRPLGNGRAYVAGPRWELLPVGVPGELLLGGVGVARGYQGRPDLTAERFVPSPWGPWDGEAGARLYRTGDRARLLPDGNLEFLGRVDHQVKVRGYRIEPGEIEAVLALHPAVREAAVVVRQDLGGHPSLMACVVPVPGAVITAGELGAAVRGSLPDYMVPAAFTVLETLPLTPSGKVDRKALARLAPVLEEGSAEQDGPRTPSEEILAGIYAQVLGREQVGSHDSFFDLGGHSLLATQVISRVRQAFGVELPVRELFEEPTVARLAGRIDRLGRAEVEAPPIVPVAREGDLPLSFAQQRLWFLERLAPGGAAYNVPLAVRLSGPLDTGALAGALGEIGRRHEALRTTFAERQGHPVQVIATEPRLPLALLDLSRLPAAEHEDEVLRLATAEMLRPFDLEAGPLARATLLRLGEEEHALLVTLHHIVTDGWSMGIFLRELTALYGGAELPEMPVQYADFAVWQRSWLSGAVLESQISYWRERLAGAPVHLTLMTDRPRPAVETHRGASLPVALPPELSRSLAALARREGATPFMVLLAGFAALLGRYSGQDDVVVGSPIAGRNRREVEGLIGFFVNTLALRVELADGPGFLDLLRQVRRTALDAYAHQDIPFERLVEELVTERDLSHSPLFQVVLTLQNAPAVTEGGVPGLMLRPVEVESGTAKFELSLGFALRGEELAGGLEYNTDLFDRATVERLARHLARLLEGAMDSPGLRLAKLPLLARSERQQLLREWGQGKEAPVGEVPVHRLVAARAAEAPEAVALVSAAGHAVTYGELWRRAARLAHLLRAAGVGPEQRVGVLLERSPEEVTSLLAVLAAGGAYVPLDPAWPRERVELVLEDAGVRVVLTTSDRDGLPPGPSLLLDRIWDGPVPASSEAPAEVDHLAYVIYTSGSTGRPKGVEITHRGLLRLLAWHHRAFGVTPADRATRLSGLAFDAAVWELWPYLTAGAAVHVPDEETRTSPAALRDWLLTQGITLGFVSTPVAEALLPLLPPAGPSPLRVLLTGGDRLHHDPGPLPFTLVNNYGPTESTVVATSGPVRDRGPGRAPDIGQPIDDTRVLLLDRELRLVPAGVAGEICIGGPGLARGYLGQPGLTAERFVPDPYATDPGERLYRTGDLARHLPDGSIDFLGRIDFQVKIRGLRIELGEIEAALLAHAKVREAAVLVREGLSGGAGSPYLVACLASAEPAVTPEELRSWLRGRLPEAMVPPAFVLLDSLPLTPNGKLDRKALAGIAPARPEDGGAEASMAPRTPAEEVLAGIFAEVLGRERVGLHNGFFDLGGHSLLATQVVSRVRQAFGLEMPIRELFEAPTVAGLVERIDRLHRSGASAAEAPPIVPVPREDGALPLSFAQQRLWFLDRLRPGSSAYNVPLAVRLTGALDAAALGHALREVARRHEVLRTTFAERGGRPVQRIAPEPRLPLAIVDMSGLPAAEREAEMMRWAEIETLRPFDLAAGPLVRATLLRLGEQEHALVVTMHHIVTDGWSRGIFLRELTELYGGRELPDLPVQYADFAAWQRSWLTGEVLESQLSYWRGHLAGAPARLTLPTDRTRPAVTTNQGAVRPVVLAPPLSRALSALARREGATPFMVLLAGFGALLGRYSGQRDVVVGTPIAGRNRWETEGLIGLFVNVLALRVELADDPGFLGLLRQARRTALEGFAHQDIPFERLVEDLVRERDLGHSPLFQVTLAMQNLPPSDAAVAGMGIRELAVESPTAKFEMSLRLVPMGEALAGDLEYNTDLFDAATAERLAGHLVRFLEQAVAAPEVPVPDLCLLAPAERQHLLRDWNDTATDYGAESRLCLHDLIRMQGERTPDAVAAVSGDEHLSYHGLARQAGGLARRLAGAGVGPDSVVGICAERSLEMIVGLLGVLEAGGAYLPLDPTYPPERLARILESAGATAVLVQEHLADLLPDARGTLRVVVPPPLGGWEAGSGGGQEGGFPTNPGNLAYVIFTSGSTGAPKGAMVSHRAIVNRLLWMQAAYGLGPADRVLQKTPFGFDVSVWEFFWPLLVGAPLVFARPEGHKDPAYLASLIAEQGITVLHFVPSMLRAFLETDRRESCVSVRAVMASGEALPFDLTERFFEWMPGELHNLYGPTEAAVDVSFWACVPGDDRRLVPIGRPIANLRLHVAERSWQPAPLGVAGELLIGGVGLGRGYLGRPDLTAERFVPDPFGGEAGSRLYRTGDLARHLPGGEIEFLGRLDFQVKIRGFRIELGEIEAALLAHDQIREAVVLARPVEGSQERRLVAYVVSEAGEEPADLRRFLGQRLPDYMVPPAIVVLPALPLSANGKIDRAALPAPEAANALVDHVEPRTALERFLASGFRDVLALPAERPVGLHDDFFALGGHSITGAIFINRLQETLSEIVHVVTLFDHPTVASLATYVTGQHPQAARRLWGEPAAVVETGEAARVGPAEIEELRRLVVTGRPDVPEEAPAPPNPPAVFVLSPPRSGSTLLRVMLGGHPGLFAPPELELLSFPTLAQRREAFQGRDSFWLEGVVRAVMEARGCGAGEAERLMAGYEDGGWSTRRFYGELQSWLGERLLVDKTPSYALDPEVLARAESWFAGPRYIHLMRDPRATNLSFEEAKLDQIFFRRPHRFTRRQLAELFWTVSHRNILDFLSALPRERWLAVRFEELVREPERVLSGICEFLGIDYRPEMADPYREGRMTDGVHDVSRMLGDVKFHTHSRVDAAAAERWRQAEEVPLGTAARELALELGYPDAAPEPVRTDVLVQLQAGAPEVRPLFCVHPVGGDVACYRELARLLGPDQPVYGLRSPQEPVPDLRQMAALYVEAARRAQPAGPYRLAGWSMGGLVAYEMARQLEEQGEAVERVALIDAASPQWWAEQPSSSDAELVAWFARDLARLFGAAQVPAVRLDAPDVDGNLARVLEAGHATGLVAAGVGLADLRRLFEVFRANRVALSSYPPLPYSGSLELIRATEPAGEAGEEGEVYYRGWSELAAGGVTIHDLPGDHYSIVLGEPAARLAGLLRAGVPEGSNP